MSAHDLELDPDDYELFDPHRNPNNTIGVAAVAWIIDRRPILLYEECEDMDDASRAVVEQSVAEAESIGRKVAQAKKTKKLCVRCKKRTIAGNRTDVCHHCSRVDSEQDYGSKGGRAVAKLQTRFQIEREEQKKRFSDALKEAKKQHKAEMKRMQSSLTVAQVTAETNQEDSIVLQLLEQLCTEDPSGDFAMKFRHKLEVARQMATSGWVPPE